VDLREIGWGSVDWIQLAQDRDRWRAVVNTVTNLRVLAPRSYLVDFRTIIPYTIGECYMSLHFLFVSQSSSYNTGTQSLIRNSENRRAPKTESFFMEVVYTPKLAFGANMPRRDTRSTHTTQVCCVQALETRPGIAPRQKHTTGLRRFCGSDNNR
jgi:hypothetical protein